MGLLIPALRSTIVLILASQVMYCLAAVNMKGPHDLKVKSEIESYGTGENFVLNTYQKWISPVKAENGCPMYPACSQFGKIAFSKWPWYKAYSRVLERLLRCGQDLHFYPIIIKSTEMYWYDPVILENGEHETHRSHNY